MSRKLHFFSFTFLLFFLCISCGEPVDENKKIEVSVEKKEILEKNDVGDSAAVIQISSSILEVLEKGEFKELAEFISDEKGILFSPYTYIDSSNVVLSKDSFLTALDSGKFFMWGLTDGKGDSIRMPIQKYFEEYVYDKNFISSDTVSFNEFVGSGNTLNNIQEKFPEAKFVEYHFFGTEMYAGMDWKSLILVFCKANDRYYLCAIVHNEWTI